MISLSVKRFIQSIESDQGYIMLLKSLFFYIAITLEAFIFCFAGEYLSNKVRIFHLCFREIIVI